MAYKDDYSSGVVLRSLARLWQASGDEGIPGAVAGVLNAKQGEVIELFNEMLKDESGGAEG